MTTRTIRSGGETYYVVRTIPQVDGGVRYACARSAREASEASARLREDPALIDHLGLVGVDARRSEEE